MLDAAIAFKNDSISLQDATSIRNLLTHPDHTHTLLGDKLAVLEHEDLRHLLEHCFRQVLELRLAGKKKEHSLRVQGVEMEEEREGRRRVEVGLRQARLDGERLLMAQQLVSLCITY